MPTELLIPGVVFLLTIAVGGVALLLGKREQAAVRSRLHHIRSGSGAVVARDEQGPSQLEAGFGWLGGLKALGGPSPKLRKTLIRAGYGNKHAAEVFFGIKVACTVFGLGLAGAAAGYLGLELTHAIFAVVGGMAIGSIVPSFVLGQRVKSREREVRGGLPNAIDLLEVCVTAGMGVDQAWVSTADEIRDATPALADEMSLVNVEMLLGVQRTDALKHMADRTGVEDLASLSSIITQADKFGTSMADALRTFAETMREARGLKAEEAAEKMAIKLMMPMVVFIFPVVLLVSAGPAGLKMAEMFNS